MDDLEINRQLLSEIFKDDYKIIVASNGVEGWEKLETNDFDVILADLIMPEIDGFEFLKKIKIVSHFSTFQSLLPPHSAMVKNKLKPLNLGYLASF